MNRVKKGLDTLRISVKKDTFLQGFQKIKKLDKTTLIKMIALLILILVGVYWQGKFGIVRVLGSGLFDKNNQRLRISHQDYPPKIGSFTKTNEEFSHSLRDYYVKTAYNCCASGEFNNDWVSLEALEHCIKQGARCLDFQIFSLDNSPVIAVSDDKDYSVKGSYNSIPFAEAMKKVNDYAFSASKTQCAGDPLLLHFRIMTNNISIMDTMADNIENILGNRRLDGYSYEHEGKNIGREPLASFKDKNGGKVIIIVDKSYTNPRNKTHLHEFVNITSNSAFMRTLRDFDVKTGDMQELMNYNKKNMTMCIPDIDGKHKNPNPVYAHGVGCQFVAMTFQNMNDSRMNYYTDFFNKEGTAFVLKPAQLRHKPNLIPAPKEAPKEHSYADRKIEADFYSFTY